MPELWSDEGMRDYSMTTKDKAAFFVTGLGVACLVAAFAFYINIVVIPNNKTARIVANECRKLLTNEKVVVDYDFWGEELVYDRIEKENDLIAMVTSKGRDKEFNTTDDIIVVMRDIIPPKTAARLVEEAGKDGDKWARRIVEAMKREGLLE